MPLRHDPILMDLPASDWDKVYADFPINRHLVWLNNAGTSSLATPVRNALEGFLDGYAREGIITGGKDYREVKSSIYSHLAALFHADPGEFALIHNTAEGMSMLSHGFDLSPGDEILILENEYPSNVYPWEHWREKGVLLRTIPCSGGPEAFLEDFREALGPRTRVAALSAVHWCTGMTLPLSEVGKLCAGQDIEFVVDGSQGVGRLDLDLSALGIGYMAFSTWKWLLGPLGLGVLFVSKDRLERLRPVFKGTGSVVEDLRYLPYQTSLKPTADRFAYSTGSLIDWVYLEASFAYLAGLGFPRVRERIRDLDLHLTQGLRGLGFTVLADGFGGQASGMVLAFRPDPGWDAGRAVQSLKKKGIIAAERLGRLRLSPHVYNSHAQLDRALAELAGL